MFPKRVRNIVFECGNSRHQRTLDRYIDGESVPVEQVRKILRDVTTPGASDSPAYEQFLEGVRLVNSRLPRVLRVRVLAADPPIQWSTVRDREDWVKFASDRDHFAAELIRRELLGKGQKALVVVGAGHLWQKNQLVKTANLASLLKRDYP